ncbi:alanyl aminopeptidase [Neolewinella aurantiaca]|uniref:Aminopeptidase N n=1 Tax=Neolewinella aurantiaca TaxID=2602767 RepID=A0A5C7FV32_9BACT|nr:M1 family aminopeptidase [Neolewinella aurantiaca]TXF89382.1 alanyl aminopeptidase [Neolewinella aurantiaca]
MRNTLPLIGLLATLLAFGCSPKTYTVAAPEMETRNLDTMTVTPAANGVIETEEIVMPTEKVIPNERPVYNAAYNRTHDLLHTRLDLSFDWAKEMVIGKATLKLKPIFKASRTLVLDAKNFDFKSITMNGKALDYTYEGDKQTVSIDLGREYTRDQEYTIVLDYTAVPAQSGGSAAITSDKGLFFINPDGTEDKPMQIWTQGETENNSRWFPTIDKPNERCTQEMYVTVQDKFKTLGNGVLENSTKNPDGTRTDYWNMELPHAPYLFALIVGEFDIVEDEPWNGIPVNYYMEDGFKDYAKDIYPYTREMLTFFSDVTGVQYPWAKYSQVAVRDYVSGAMENTTAVIFGEFMHGTDRELIDVETNEKIVAHEMFHHWFGDYVTTESWSNLTLNEGFANYSEYLWMEKKHGRDAADFHMMSERSGYFGSAQRGIHELIWYDFEDKEQMFDAHSYNKGGAVLHMLRDYLGDEAFFAGLTKYLNDNKFSAVEVDELRMAFEDLTGEDLNWFFDQWFLSAGHPALKVETGYADGKVMLTVEQTQDTDENVPGVFRLPTKVAIFTNGSTTPEMMDIVIDERKQTFTFPSSVKPDVVVLDPMHTLLAQFNYTKTTEELAAQFKGAPSLVDRMLVLQRLGNKEDSALKTEVVSMALNDPFHGVREAALGMIVESADENQLKVVRSLAKSDPHSSVRATAIQVLAANEDSELKAISEMALDAKPYPVVSAGLQGLVVADPTAATAAATKLEALDNPSVNSALASLYAEAGDPAKLPFFEKQMKVADGYGALDVMDGYRTLLAKGTPAQMTAGLEKMVAMAKDQNQSLFRRLAATKALNDMREEAKAAGTTDVVTKLGTMISAIKAVETDPNLQRFYQQFGG